MKRLMRAILALAPTRRIPYASSIEEFHLINERSQWSVLNLSQPTERKYPSAFLAVMSAISIKLMLVAAER